jgi:hypothetical protein
VRRLLNNCWKSFLLYDKDYHGIINEETKVWRSPCVLGRNFIGIPRDVSKTSTSAPCPSRRDRDDGHDDM